MIGKNVLIISDDTEFFHFTGPILEKSGAQVIAAQDGMEGIIKIFVHQPDLILLHVRMLESDGFTICRRIREASSTPIILLAPLVQDHVLLRGLDAGADDFLSIPFSSEIFLARAKAVLRRSEQGNGHQGEFNYDDGHLKIDVEKHRVQIKNQLIMLTPVEFRLLAYLLRNAGTVMSFNDILKNVWGREYAGTTDYVHVYISHLRRKIEEVTKSPRYIVTVHGVGYSFEKQDSAA